LSDRRISSVRLIWLEAYIAVYDLGSFTDAGKALGVDQSTVTRYVRQLEHWLRKLLILDGSLPPFFTDDGKDFVDTAREIVRLMQDSRARLPARTPKRKISAHHIVINS